MSDDLEKSLRAALRPVDPGERFTQQVMTRLKDPTSQPRRPAQLGHARTWMALAACVLLAVVGASVWQMHRISQGLEARRQLLQALRVTGRKLDLAYRAVNDIQPRSSRPSGV